MQNNTGNGIEECAGNKHLPGKHTAGKAEQDNHSSCPYHTAGNHSDNQAAVQHAGALPARPAVKEARYKGIGCHLECHGKGTGHAGHEKQCKAQNGHNKADGGAVLPATDQGAEEHR